MRITINLMKVFTKIPLAFVALVAVTFSTPLQAADTVKVVYQCDFPDVQRVHLMLNTLTNIVKQYQSKAIDFDINVVAFGPCLQYFMKDFEGTGFVEKPYLKKGGPLGNGTQGRFKALKLQGDDGVTFHACENTMQKKNVKSDQLMDNIEKTPSGVVKVIELEQKGYAYIKIQ